MIFPNIGVDAEIDRLHARQVVTCEANEIDSKPMAKLERRMRSEIGEPLPLFFRHMIAVRLVR